MALSRATQTSYLRDGLELLQVATLFKNYPEQLRSVLVYNENQKMDAATFRAQVAAVEPMNTVHKCVYQYFNEYVSSKDTQGKKLVMCVNIVISVVFLDGIQTQMIRKRLP